MSSAADVLGALGGALPGASNSVASGAAGTFQDYLDAFANNAAPTGTSAPNASSLVQGASNALNSYALLSNPSRLAAFVIGIILIGVGVLMFRGTQTVISTAGRLAA